MKEKTLEEQANELLLISCRAEGLSMRAAGLIDARYQDLIRSREVTVSDLMSVSGIVSYRRNAQRPPKGEED